MNPARRSAVILTALAFGTRMPSGKVCALHNGGRSTRGFTSRAGRRSLPCNPSSFGSLPWLLSDSESKARSPFDRLRVFEYLTLHTLDSS